MREFVLRHFPEPIIRMLKPVYHFFLGIRKRFRRLRRWWRAKRPIATAFRRTGAWFRRVFTRGGNPERAKGPERPRRRRRDVLDHPDVVRLRDEVRRSGAEMRRMKRELLKVAGEPDPLSGGWRGQVVELGGGGLRDLAFFPGGVQNPYLRLLYSRCVEVGFEPRGLGQFELLDRVSGSGVFHLHWTRVFQVGAGSEGEARAQSEGYLGRVERLVGRGGRLVWSVHEWLPHDCEFPDVEVELRRRLVGLASAVHVLHESTAGEVEGLYPLDPGRTFTVEHPLYSGVYPDYVTRESARRLLGVGPDEVVLLGFGAIRPYKGFDRLVGLVPVLRERMGLPVRVLIAGPAFKSVDLGPLRDLVAGTEGASMTERPVPDEHVQVLFRAADVVVLPYRKVLNSGVLMLGLTFGCPSVAPENPVTRDTVGSGLVHLFERESDEDLVRAVVEAVERRGDRGGLPPEFVARYDPAVISGQFAHQLTTRVGDPEPSE